MAKKTLLLVFIHGFKGGDDTFSQFPSYLRALLTHALPKLQIVQIQYPKFETRGDLHDCVVRFKEWLQNKVIDLECAAQTPSPTIDPSVRTLLIGHSMGGIVAAETVLSILNDQPIPSSNNSSYHNNSSQSMDPRLSNSSSMGASLKSDGSTNAFMFPYICGVLAFDTPYLGIAPGVVAHGAEGHWNAASTAYSTYNSVANAFGWGGQAAQETQTAMNSSKMLPAASANAGADVASVPAWQKYGRYAMFAGAAGALVAGGVGAYMKRDAISSNITEGWGWASSHLEFVGCLARGEELTKRLKSIIALEQSGSGFGFANLYTTLGRAVEGKSQWASSVVGSERTFCTIPKSEAKRYFEPQVNDKATAETWAHMTMFTPKDNPGYYAMSEAAKERISEWVLRTGWYESIEDEGMGGEAVDGAGMEKSFEDEAEMVETPILEAEEEELVSIDELQDASGEKKGKKGEVKVEDNPWA